MTVETKNMTIRLPLDVYEDLRVEAFKKRAPIATVIIAAIRDRHSERAAERRACDYLDCAKPSTHTTTPGGFRFCDEHRIIASGDTP